MVTIDAQVHADGQVTVVEPLPVRQLGIAAIGLPLGGRPTTTATGLRVESMTDSFS